MSRVAAWMLVVACAGCGEPGDGSRPPGCEGVRTDRPDGTTSIACEDGTRELVCTRADCGGISSLTIVGTDLDRVVLPALTHVDALDVAGNLELEELRVPALTGDWLTVWGNPVLTVLDAPALETLRPRAVEPTRCAINGNASLASLSLPGLTSADLTVSGNAGLTEVSLPVLTEAGALEVAENPALVTLSLPALRSVRDLRLWANPVLFTVSVPELTTVTGELRITANSSYPQCAAEAIVAQLTDYTGTPVILFNDTTATCP